MFVVLYVLTIFSAYGTPAAISQHRDEDACHQAYKEILAQRAVQKLSLEVSHTCSKTDVLVQGVAPAAAADTSSAPRGIGTAQDKIASRQKSTSESDDAEYRKFCEANPMMPNCRGRIWTDQPAPKP